MVAIETHRLKLSATLFAMLAGGVLLIAACTGNDSQDSAPVETPALTAEDQVYLDEVAQAFTRSDANFDKFGDLLAESFASPEAILSALVEAGAGTSFDPVLEALTEIEPTERFVEDHRTFVEGLEKMVEADQAIGAAAADDDIVAFELGNVNLGVVQSAMRLELSFEACNIVPQTQQLCTAPGELPGGDYGAALNGVMQGLAAGLLPRVGVLQESPQGAFLALTYLLRYTPEELVELYGAVEQDAMAVLADSASAVDDLEPPDDFAADHERLQAWFDETSDTLTALFLATGQDDGDERARLQWQFRLAFCSAADDFSPEAIALVGVVFIPPPEGPGSETCS